MSNATNNAFKPKEALDEMTTHDLIAVVKANPLIAKACMHLAVAMISVDDERRRSEMGRATFNARYEIVVTGTQVTSGVYKFMLTTVDVDTPGRG